MEEIGHIILTHVGLLVKGQAELLGPLKHVLERLLRFLDSAVEKSNRITK